MESLISEALAHIFDDHLVELRSRNLDGRGNRDAVHRDHADVRRAAADVHDHAALRGADVEMCAQSGRQRLFDQVDPAGAGLHRRLNDRALLDLGDTAGHAHDHARLDDGKAHDAADHLRQHPRGQLIVGDHAVLKRVDGRHIARRTAEHVARRRADLQNFAGVLVQRNDGRFAQDDALARRIDQYIGSSQVDAQVLGK